MSILTQHIIVIIFLFTPPYGSMEVYLSLLCVFFVCLSFCSYGYGFLSGGKSQGHEILHACWPAIRIGLLPFGGQRSRSPGTKNVLSVAKPHPAYTRMVCQVVAVVPADEHICCRVRGDISGGVHRGSELGSGALTVWRTVFPVWRGMRLASLLMHLFLFFLP